MSKVDDALVGVVTAVDQLKEARQELSEDNKKLEAERKEITHKMQDNEIDIQRADRVTKRLTKLIA